MSFSVSFTDTLHVHKKNKYEFYMILCTKKFGKLERWIWKENRNTIHFQLAPWLWLVLIAYIDRSSDFWMNFITILFIGIVLISLTRNANAKFYF